MSVKTIHIVVIYDPNDTKNKTIDRVYTDPSNAQKLVTFLNHRYKELNMSDTHLADYVSRSVDFEFEEN